MATIINDGVIGGKPMKRVCQLTGMNEYEALGRLASLWESSQELERDVGTANQIGFWLGASSPEEEQRLVRAYSDSLAGFLEPVGDQFRIVGNGKHIEKKKVMSEANRARVMRRWEKERGAAVAVPPEPKNDTGGIPTANPPHTPGIPNGYLYCTVPGCTVLNCTVHPPKPPATNGTNHSITSDHVEACKQTWATTLKACRKERPMTSDEETAIVRALVTHGFEAVELALYGATFEPAHEGFDPKQHVDIFRVLTKDAEGKPRIQKFMSYGAEARAKAAEKKQREAENQAARESASRPPDDPELEQNPDKVREIIGKFLKPVAGGGAA